MMSELEKMASQKILSREEWNFMLNAQYSGNDYPITVRYLLNRVNTSGISAK